MGVFRFSWVCNGILTTHFVVIVTVVAQKKICLNLHRFFLLLSEKYVDFFLFKFKMVNFNSFPLPSFVKFFFSLSAFISLAVFQWNFHVLITIDESHVYREALSRKVGGIWMMRIFFQPNKFPLVTCFKLNFFFLPNKRYIAFYYIK